MWDNVFYQEDALARLGNLEGRLFVLADSHTYELCYPVLSPYMPSHTTWVVEAGEGAKTLATSNQIWKWLYRNKAGRGDTLLTLGGGVVCDLGAFAASVFKRGMHVVHCPTTLLAMVDAAHGSKTAIDHRGTKNLLGTFYKADAVLVLPHLLDTLPQEELLNGWAEVAKHMVLAQPQQWRTGEAYHPERSVSTIQASIKVKQRIVFADPYEMGLRKVLNLGHTVGHALEAYSWAQEVPLKHGYAVAWGLYSEACIGVELGVTDHSLAEELLTWVAKLYPRPFFTSFRKKKLKAYLIQDKKNIDGSLMLSVCRVAGEPHFNVPVDIESVLSKIREHYFD